MKVFGTDMDLVTFVFIILETIMFICQLLFFIQKPSERKRRYYIILLGLLIIYNICGGLFPDPNNSVPIVVQNILAYGSGFIMACYLPYYFFKAFELDSLKFHARYGVTLFLFTPFLLFIVIEYSLFRNIDRAVDHSVIIPAVYSVIVLWAILRAIRLKYREDYRHKTEMLLTYAAIVPWVSMPVFSFYKVNQLTEVLFTNCGFIIITVLFIWEVIKQSRMDNLILLGLNNGSSNKTENINNGLVSSFNVNCENYRLTSREIEIAILICEGIKYREIAEQLFISERTVTKHVQNMFLKTKSTNKTLLIRSLRGS